MIVYHIYGLNYFYQYIQLDVDVISTPCGLMTPYGNTDIGQHWLRLLLVAWRHQAITWTSVDFSSVRSSDIQLRAI